MTIYSEVLAAQEIIDSCYNPETGEIFDDIDLAEKLKAETIGNGLDVLCKVRANYLADSAYLKAEYERIKTKKESIDKRIKNIENYILAIHKLSGSQKSIAGTFTVSTRKSTQVVLSDDFNNPEFMRTKTIIEPDKAAIKEALKAGNLIAGAALQENENLTIK